MSVLYAELVISTCGACAGSYKYSSKTKAKRGERV